MHHHVSNDEHQAGSKPLVLLHLAAAARNSALFSLATTLGRVDDLAHIMVWAELSAASRTGAAAAECFVKLVELPRVGVSFTPKRDTLGSHGGGANEAEQASMHLFCREHDGLAIANLTHDALHHSTAAAVGSASLAASPTRALTSWHRKWTDLLRGLPHVRRRVVACLVASHIVSFVQALILRNAEQYFVLVPTHRLYRPRVRSRPYHADLIQVQCTVQVSRLSEAHMLHCAAEGRRRSTVGCRHVTPSLCVPSPPIAAVHDTSECQLRPLLALCTPVGPRLCRCLTPGAPVCQ